MARFKKGSAAAKAYMAKLRGMVRRKKKVLNVSSPSKSSETKPRMTRRYGRFRRHRSRGGMTIPIAPIIGVLAAPAIYNAIGAVIAGDFNTAIKHAKGLVGMSGPNFNAVELVSNLTPIIAGLLVHKFVGGKPLNLNGMLARSKIPVIRI